jgi:ATP-dependent Clp protease ATP-binding subunit ClpC
VDFRNTIIVFTSNIGTERLSHKGNLGFNDEDMDALRKKEYVLAELKNYLRPEFLNRIDEVVLFNSLRGPELEAIFASIIDEINAGIAIQAFPQSPP